MKKTLHMAVSIDGFVAGPGGDISWVSKADFKLFEQRYKEAGSIIMGRTTFDEFDNPDYPFDDITTVVLTTGKDKPGHKSAMFTSTPAEAIAAAKSKGHARVLLAGGGKTNAAFLKAGLIDEIYLTVHPIALGQGIRLFEGADAPAQLKLVSVSHLENELVQLHYGVMKAE
jgi:dihydrofolate reductase